MNAKTPSRQDQKRQEEKENAISITSHYCLVQICARREENSNRRVAENAEENAERTNAGSSSRHISLRARRLGGCIWLRPCRAVCSSLSLFPWRFQPWRLGVLAFNQSFFSIETKQSFASTGFSITFRSSNCFPNSSHRFGSIVPSPCCLVQSVSINGFCASAAAEKVS